MSELLDTAYQKIADEYHYLGTVNHVYTRAVENGSLLAGTKFGDEGLADQSSESYLQALREAIAQIEDFGSVVVNITGKNVVTVRPQIEDTRTEDGSCVSQIEVNEGSVSDKSQINDVSGVYRDIFVETDRDAFGGFTVAPRVVVRDALSTHRLLRSPAGVPLMGYGVETFATAPLDGSAEFVVPRFEVLDRYNHALGVLATNSAEYPWFTDTAARLIGDLDSQQVDVAGRRVRQLGRALDRLDDSGVYQQGVEALSGILCGNDVIVYSHTPENSEYKDLVAQGILIDIESKKTHAETSIIIETDNNGESSVYRFPMKAVVSVQQIG